jgi:glutaredoxin 3
MSSSPAPATPAGRCVVHGLAAGPEGRCVICRRADRAPPSDGRRIALTALGLLLAAIVGSIVWKRWPAPARTAPGPEAAAAPPELPEPEARKEDAPSRPPASPTAFIPPARRAPPATPPEGPPARIAERAANPPPDAEDALERRRELSAAMRSVPIRMYTTSWCPVCTKAKAWMAAKQIAYVELDVEASEGNRRAQRALNPRGGVPTIDIDGEVIVGFGPSDVEAAIRRAAERRLLR